MKSFKEACPSFGSQRLKRNEKDKCLKKIKEKRRNVKREAFRIFADVGFQKFG